MEPTPSQLDELRDHLRRSRASLLAAILDLPEDPLQHPGAVGPWSVAQVVAQRIEAESRALTLVQSMLHGHPLYPRLDEAGLDRLAVARRRDWGWANLMADLYQQREETTINLADLAGQVLTRAANIAGRTLTPYEVLSTLARDEEALALRLAAWRCGLDEKKRS